MNSPSWRQDVKTAAYFLKLVHTISRSYLPLVVTAAFFKAATPFLNILMPKFILDELMGRQRIETFVVLVLSLIHISGETRTHTF